MDAPAKLHPTDHALSSFGLGELDDASGAAVNRHLESCPGCRNRFAALSSDRFPGRLSAAHGKDRSDSPASRSSSDAGLSMLANDDSSAAGPPLASSLPRGLADLPDYRILRELGQGGMGVVYLAENTLMGRKEVLKVVGSHLANRRGVLDRFVGEIRNAARLHHPNVVTAYAVIRLGQSLVLSMEYVEGLDLARLVKARGPLPVAYACNYVHQAALGLQHAHECGMIHRDIKPGNLMLSSQRGRAMIKVLDFGLAKEIREGPADGALTHEGQMLGTPDYIAPEQIVDARRADIRADVYSLGCTLYYLLTAGPPFRGTNLYDILQAHHSRDALPLNLARPDVPTEVAAIVSKMMAKEPEQRFQEPKHVAQALLPFFKKGQSGPARSKPEIAEPVQSGAYDLVSTPTEAATDAARSATRGEEAANPSARRSKSRDGLAPREETSGAGPLPLGPRLRYDHRVGIGVACAVLTIALGLWAFGAIRVRTAHGVLVVEFSEPNSNVQVDGEKVTITAQDGGATEVTVTQGTPNVEVKKDGLQVSGDKVTLEDHGQKVLIAKFEPNPPAVALEGAPVSDIAENKNEEEGEIVVGHQVKPRMPSRTSPTSAELTAIRNADVDRGKSVRASTDPAGIAEIVGEVAPGFTARSPVIPGGVAIVAEYFGRTRILSTHPLDAFRPCVLTSTIDVPANKKTLLRLSVSHSAAGDWQLIVLANGEQLFESIVGPQTARNGWLPVSVNLTRFAGKQIVLELQNKATGYSHEWGFWDKIGVVAPRV